MANFDSQWVADGWTAGGWTSWTGGNDWENRRIDSEALALHQSTALLEARISSLEQKVAALRLADQAEVVPEVVSPELPEPQHPCDWHEQRANAGEAVSVSGIQERSPNSWLDHLRNTLYSEDSRPLDAFEGKIRAHWQCIEVTACRTQANRSFHVRCKKCDQYSYGRFGWWADQSADGQDSAGGARDDLAKFFKAQVPPGERKV